MAITIVGASARCCAGLLLAALLPIARLPSADQTETRPLPCVTTWVGNTFGTSEAWVQMAAEALQVAPDGTCFTNVFWEEGGNNVSWYKDGALAGAALHTHGWGYEGGSAVTANARYLFIAQTAGNEGGGLKSAASWPPKGKKWLGVSRRDRHDPRKGAPFAGGKGGDGDTLKASFQPVLEPDERSEARIAGLAADEITVYVATPSADAIALLDVETMQPKGSWPIAGAQQLCADRDGTLWAVQRIAGGAARIIHLGKDGAAIGAPLTGIEEPRGLALDGKGRLYVADAGPDQQIKIVSDLATAPRVSGTLGVKGGIYAAPRGKVGPLRFNAPSGVGVDASGNVYVASTGNGFVLECYSPAGALVWKLEGLEFVDCADVDPGSDQDLYTKEEHLVCDWSKPAGKEWSYRGYTLDRLAFPEDARNGHAEFASTWARRIQGHLVVFGIDMYAQHLLVYRPGGDGEILVPSGMIAKGHIGKTGEAWPPHQPEKGEWIWRDGDGDGAFSAGEYESTGRDAPGMEWGWWVDGAGDIWQAGKGGVRRLPFQGFDSHGNPRWSLAKAELRPMPAPFTGLERLIRDPGQDTMILSGWSAEFPNAKGNWKTPGKVIARYDHWGTPASTTKRWEIHPPFDESAEHSRGGGTTVAMASAGDYLFVAYLISAEVRVYALADGAYVGSLLPAKGLSGWVDLPYGINALKRADGEYLVVVEEDAKAKNLVYRWKPGAR